MITNIETEHKQEVIGKKADPEMYLKLSHWIKK